MLFLDDKPTVTEIAKLSEVKFQIIVVLFAGWDV